MDLMVTGLQKCLDDVSIKSDFYIAGFNQYIQEIVNPGSVLHSGGFDIVILFVDGETLFQNVICEPFKYKDSDINQFVDIEINNLRSYAEEIIDSNKKSVFFINNIVIRKPTILGTLDNNSEFGISTLQEKFNYKMGEIKLSERVVIIDFAAIISRYGYEAVYDNRLWHLGRIKFSSRGLQHLSELYSSYIQAYLGKSKKVLILDLDNTLWGGVIGEDGLEGIKVGNDGIGMAYRNFQRLIKALKYKGVLLTICSKNNLEDIKEVFENKEFMELKENDFVMFKINWGNKADNIREIATALNLGIDSFVFIDDNKFEREMVKIALPQIVVPEFPEDPADLCQWFIDLSFKYFNNITITNEDKLRTDIYQADTKRKELEKTTTTIEDFYKSLEMTAIIKIDSHADFKRISQLTQKTNQFNLTVRRYTENEMLNLMNSYNWMIFSLELNDRFGPNGIVGVIIIRIDEEIAYIDTFLLSCRVIGRTVENSFVSCVMEVLRKKDITKVIGEYIPTKKNIIVKDMYNNFKFKLIKEEDDSSTIWELDLNKEILEGSSWLNLRLIQ